MTEPGLSALSLATLRALTDATERGTLSCPISPTGISSAGFAVQREVLLRALADLDRTAVLAVLRAVIAERIHQRASNLELVWTGPLTPQAANRDTGVVMRQLFTRAEHDVLIGGFRFDAGADLFEPLHRAMVERGVTTTIFLDIEGNAATHAGGPAYAQARIGEFLEKNWPFGEPHPAIYYDPRTAAPGPPWVSLHAKCVVVDARWSLVTSANFTDRAQTRNIELGVLIEDEAFGTKLVAQWRVLVGQRLVERHSEP